MSANQYISVSGVGSLREIDSIEQCVPTGQDGPVPNLLIGIQASEKSQFHKVENSRGRNWHPVGDEIWRLFAESDLPRIAKRIIHYSYADTLDPQGISKLTTELLDRTPEDCKVDGWQFNNVAWHEHDYSPLLASTTARLGGQFLIAQLSGQLLANADPVELAKRLGDSGASHALLDSSGGAGIGYDKDEYERFIDALTEHAPHLGIGIAGGLHGGEGLSNYKQNLVKNPNLSCDAEGNLRDYDELHERRLAGSKLNIDRAIQYVADAYETICGAKTAYKQ